jgi:hypothetical protein
MDLPGVISPGLRSQHHPDLRSSVWLVAHCRHNDGSDDFSQLGVTLPGILENWIMGQGFILKRPERNIPAKAWQWNHYVNNNIYNQHKVYQKTPNVARRAHEAEMAARSWPIPNNGAASPEFLSW